MPVLREPVGGAERVLAADRDQAVEPRGARASPAPARGRPRACTGWCASCPGSCRRAAGSRASTRSSARRRRPRARPRQPSRKPTSSIAVGVDPLAHDGADDRVEPGAVAASGEHADAHGRNPMRSRRGDCNDPVTGRDRVAPRMAAASVVAVSSPSTARRRRAPLAGLAGPAPPSRPARATTTIAALSAPLGGRPLAVDLGRRHPRCTPSGSGPRRQPSSSSPTAGPSALTFWGPVIRRLVDAGLAPVAYDLRGHGASADGGRRRLLAGALRRRRGGGARRRRAGRRAGRRRRALARRHVDRRLGRSLTTSRAACTPRR